MTEQPDELRAELVGVGDIYQAGRDQHIYYQDGVRRRRRPATGHTVDVCPYPGLAAFGSQHAQWFFGRDRLIADLTIRLDERLRTGRPLIVVAPSGAGKSSLLRAGLLPALADGALEHSRHWPQLMFTPTARPMMTLAYQVAAATGADPDQVAWAMASNRVGWLGWLRESGVRLVVVVDQLEELFTQCPNEQERLIFLDTLSRLAAVGTDGRPPTALVVFGLRADFYARGAEYPLLRDVLQHDQVLVGPMSTDELREAILYPARDVGLEVEPGLVEVLLTEIGGAGYEAGRLPLLAHALRATWQQRHGHLMTVAGYQDTGRIQGAVATTAEETFTRLPEASRRATRLLFLRLIVIGAGIDHTRRRMDRTSLIGTTPHPAATAEALDAFTRARLLTQQHDTVEITHEALLRAWPRLAEWLNTDRAGLLVHRRLADAVKAWLDVRRDTGSLYRGAQLADVRAWLDGREDRAADLSTAEGEFVTASVAAEEADREFIRRNNRRLRRGIAGLTVLVVVTLIASGLAVWQQRVANGQRVRALAQQAIALSREYAAESLSASSTDPHRSLLLAAAAWQASPTEEARSAILSAQTEPYEGTLGPADGRLWNVALSPDGTIAALATYAGTVTLWDTASHRELARLTGPDGQADVAFSPDGRIVATANISDDTAKQVRLWDAHTHQLIRTLPAQAFSMRFSSDGGSLVTEYQSAVVLWDVATGREIRSYSGDADALGVAISHDGSLIAAGDSDSTVHLWLTATGEQVAVLSGHTKPALSVDFSPNDALLASSSGDGTVRLWNVAQRRAAGMLGAPGGNEYIKQVLFSPDGSYVAATTNAARTVQLWRVSDGASLGALVGHTESVASIAFSRDGHTLLSGSLDQTGILWRLQSSVLFQPNLAAAVAFSPDGRLLASSSGLTTTLWDAARRDPVRILSGGAGVLSFSPDGRTIAAADYQGTVPLWDVATGKSRRAFAFGAGFVTYMVAFSPDGRTLAAVAGPPLNAITSNAVTLPIFYEVRQWDVATGKVLVTTNYKVMNASADPYPGGQIAFSPDSDVLAIPLTNGSTELRQPRTGTRVGVLAGQQGVVTTVAFSPDGTVLATGGSDRTVVLWNMTTRQQVGARLVGHNGVIRGIAFLPGGHTLATVSDNDPALRLWDVASHAPLAAIQGAAGSFSGIATQSATGLMATVATNAVDLWNPDPARVLSTICAALRGQQPIATAWRAISSATPAPRC